MQVCSVVCGKNRLERLRHPFEAIDHGNQNVFAAARAEIGKDFHPEFRAFGLLNPQAKDVACAVGANAQGEIDRFGPDDAFIANLHA